MTDDEKNECINVADSILELDLEAIAASVYPNRQLQEIFIHTFSLPEFLTLLKRAVKQLKAELSTGNWKILPNGFTDINGAGISITTEIEYILRKLREQDDFSIWHTEFMSIILYEMHYGFWDRSETRIHSPDELSLAKAQTDVSILTQSINARLSDVNNIYKKLEGGIKQLESYAAQKEQQFSSLDKTLERAAKSLSNVRTSEKEAATSQVKIVTLLEQADKAIEDSRKKIADDRKEFIEFRGEISSVMSRVSDEFDQLNHHREEFDELVVSAREAESHILDQEERIMTLVGFAADGTLGGVFNNRKKELQWPVYLWTALSLASVGLAVYWVLYVFKQTPSQDHNGINWLILAANVVRTSPVFLLVYFCLSQYTKERNIQEEYAFKAAISMTVTAYADMIGTGEVNERVKMLMDTIQRIYVPPVLGKPVKPISLKSKHLAQATKNMADTASNLKTAVTDTLKNIKPDKSD